MMDASDLNRLLSSGHYSPADLDRVIEVCRNYPMFNLAHMLRVRMLEILGYNKEAELRIAAIYSGDRRKLFELVTGAVKPVIGLEPQPEQPEGIRFSDEPHHEAEMIIEQHAPYAGAAAAGGIQESMEARGKEDFMLDPGSGEEISSETMIETFVKDEADLEEGESNDQEFPAIDQLDTEKEGPNTEKLILRFITEDPGPIRANLTTGVRGDVSIDSIREHDGFITDTLAQIYVKQGLFAKAIYAYERLSLKYPEKSAYFAAQIEKIRNINRS
jgi:hypothetical protein